MSLLCTARASAPPAFYNPLSPAALHPPQCWHHHGMRLGSGIQTRQVGAWPLGRATGASPEVGSSQELKFWLWEEKLEKAGPPVADLLDG